jgi:hypothetical protein
MPNLIRRRTSLMPEIVADPLSAFCYRLFSGPGIIRSQRLGSDAFLRRAHARERSFGAAWSGKSADVWCNPYLNLAADSLQIAQTVKGDSIRDCDCAGVGMRVARRRGRQIAQFPVPFHAAVRPVWRC